MTTASQYTADEQQVLTLQGTLLSSETGMETAQPCWVQHEQLLGKGPCSACRTGRSSCLCPSKGIREWEWHLEQTHMVEYAPFPAQQYQEKKSLQDSAPGLPAVLIPSPRGSVSGDEGHAHKQTHDLLLGCSCSCGWHWLWLLQLPLAVGAVGLRALPVQQLPPGLQALAPRTAATLEAGLVVAGLALCEGEHG